ncbi:MAG: autorepressor SdpR family transcription factor [Hyphomonadaceae bacterium]|nr:autorepressor SdpR family transcription factor [Hyphomonadaceae bacterium]
MNAVFKALADPTRRKVLELLRKQPMTAGELADNFPVSRPTMSAHFAVLREADLIEAIKIGTTITYQLKLSVLEDALLGFARLFTTEVGAPSKVRSAKKVASKRARKGAPA